MIYVLSRARDLPPAAPVEETAGHLFERRRIDRTGLGAVRTVKVCEK
jgi:hypothetical protein